jgi:leucyl/phenylalanyl-tRNA---protein transferase
MPVYQLIEEIVFPHPSLAEKDGLLAIGGDLSPDRILTAYVNGIFPWYNKKDPILWWSPDPRCVLFPEKYKPSKSLLSLIKKNTFEIRFDYDFNSVIGNCASVKRVKEKGTWITPAMKKAYQLLHTLGFAHSAEAYIDGKLAGGLYGVAIGKVFFGESMFYHVSNASKVAFFYLVKHLKEKGFELLDCQVSTPHMLNLGAEEIRREEFLKILNRSVGKAATF